MDVQQIRRANLRMLVDSTGGPTLFAERIERTQSLVSQWCSSKPIGHSAARYLETKLSKPRGWFDHPQWLATGGVAAGQEVDPQDVLARLLQMLPPDERALLENYRASGDAGRALVAASAAAVAQQHERKGNRKHGK
jgi:hypothetical protein